MGRERNVRIAALLVSALAGALWVANYPLRPLDTGLVVLAHLVAGAGLALFLPPVLRRLAPRAPVAAAALTSTLLLIVLPALLSLLPFAGLSRPLRASAVLAVGGGLLALGIAVGRAGWWASLLTAGALLALLVALGQKDVEVLPARPTVEVERSDSAARRLLVIGLDGADWSVVDPLLEKGELPHLARLVGTGVTGVLESFEPSASPVVWSSIFSGKTPEKHGITGWHVAHAANRRAAMLWEMIAGAGLDSLVVNVPGTWPPGRIRGSLVSGFPIPGVVRNLPGIEGSHYLGTVVAPAERGGLIPTAIASRRPDGSLHAEVTIGEVPPEPRVALRHYPIDVLIRHRLLGTPTKRIPVRIEPADGRAPQRVEIEGREFELAQGAWSGWLETDVADVGARFRVRRVGDDGLYFTPPFQDPEAPLFPFTSGPEVRARISQDAMYVVEGAGWKGAVDPDIHDALFEHLLDVEQQHVDATRALASMTPEWSLLIHIFTVTDRVSHGFWHVSQPGLHGVADEEGGEPGPLVREAYRWVDRRMGELLDEIGDGATVVLLSDHGFQADPSMGYGGHRVEGILVASGPGIRPSGERLMLSVLDVTPTLLALLGLPVAADMDGQIAGRVLAGHGSPRRVATYEQQSDSEQRSRTQIDDTTEEQLRSLGYVE